jgi:hypothetical protein
MDLLEDHKIDSELSKLPGMDENATFGYHIINLSDGRRSTSANAITEANNGCSFVRLLAISRTATPDPMRKPIT